MSCGSSVFTQVTRCFARPGFTDPGQASLQDADITKPGRARRHPPSPGVLPVLVGELIKVAVAALGRLGVS